MSIAFSCDQCGKAFKVKDELAGKKAKCTCGHVLFVPQQAPPVEEDMYDIKDDEPPKPAPVTRPVPAVAAPAAVSAKSSPVKTTTPAKPSAPVAPSRSVQRFAYLILIAALIPLAWNIFIPSVDVEEAIKSTIKHHPEIESKLKQVMEAENADEEDFFKVLPGHKLDGAWLAHDTYQHWLYALLSSAAFTALILGIFPKSTESIGKMIAVGAFTATIGIFLLLGFQFVAEWTQGFYLRGRGIIVLLFYVVKFIGFSYHAAMDEKNGFMLSALGFTFGVGLCEEICKSLPVLFHYQTKAEWPWRTACLVGLISGVGFGVSEGITYCSDFYNGITGGDIYLVRFISCVALHAVWSGAAAIFIYRHQAQLQGSEHFLNGMMTWVMLVSIPMVLHGLYDTLLKKHMDGLALLTALVSFAWMIYLIEGARRDFDAQEEISNRSLARAAMV